MKSFKGKKFRFYGAFGKKSKAKTCEREHPGSFIRPRSISGHRRYVVMKPLQR